jgi:hypothetical protein
MYYDIKNPTTGVRVIYDGIPESMKAITVAPGAEKKNVKLSDAVVSELAERNKAKPDSDLIATMVQQDAATDTDQKQVAGRRR